MKNFLLATAFSALSCLGAIPAAYASPENFSAITGGSYSVNVWSGAGITDTASQAAFSTLGTPLAIFTYTGPIDFQNNASNNGQDATLNTFADFGLSTANISDFIPLGVASEAAFLATTMSLEGFSVNTAMTFSGNYTASPGTTISFAHDDGISFYAGPGAGPLIDSASPTSEAISNATLPAGANSFELLYVESNGSPSDLIATVSNVPEPGSLALLGTGLLGLLLRRRRP